MASPKAPVPERTGFEDRTDAQLREVVYRNDPTLRCRNMPADMFFRSDSAAYARFLCSGCPIAGQCLELSLREETVTYVSGIRGGLSPRDRRAMLRQRAT